MNAVDYVVLLATLLGIAGYGVWRTRGQRDLATYVKGSAQTNWLTIGVSVMATQASAVTFLSTPGQGYQDGLGFIQNYFGAPLALVIICIFFLPVFRCLNVYTAYEYLGQRFDRKTRLLGAGLFLIQRGIGAGLTIYAPAIVLSSVFNWSLPLTIIASGLVVIAYTVSGGSEAVSLTQKYQFVVIMIGMVAAFVVVLMRLPAQLHFREAMVVAGGMHKLKAVDFSPSLQTRYTLWTGLIGGLFLQLSYFGSDQSQVQRYLGGRSLRESRLGLMFNAVFKIPMQFFILLLGALIFVFYQFERPPVYFNRPAWTRAVEGDRGPELRRIEAEFNSVEVAKGVAIQEWLDAARKGDKSAAEAAHGTAIAADTRAEALRTQTQRVLTEQNSHTPSTDADYVFITFILDHLPHGLIGLLVTVFFAATLNSKAAELNALASSTTVDLYRHLIRSTATDEHCVTASRWFTALWGFAAIGIALSVTLVENLIQFANIVASIFYPVVLGLFLVAFFLKKIGGTAVFWGAIAAQILVCALYFSRNLYPSLSVAYLWYNLIGCVACVLLAAVFQSLFGSIRESPA
ncbi:MAG TPA: sodium:solute symporter [Opitutaceae bacterium]